MAKSIGGALLRGALGGIQAGAGAKALSLGEEAKQARAISLESLKQTGRMKVVERQGEIGNVRQSNLIVANKDAAKLVMEEGTRQFDTNTALKEHGIKNAEDILTEKKRRNLILEAEAERAAKAREDITVSEGAKGRAAKRENIGLEGRIRAVLQTAQGKTALRNSIEVIKEKSAGEDTVRMKNLARIRETDGYKSMTPQDQGWYDAEFLTNGKVEEGNYKSLMGFGAGVEIDAPTSAQYQDAKDLLGDMKAVSGMGPHAQYIYFMIEATKAANPTVDIGWGTKDLKNPEDAIKVAQQLISKELSYSDFAMFSPDSKELVFGAMSELEKIMYPETTRLGSLKGVPRTERDIPILGTGEISNIQPGAYGDDAIPEQFGGIKGAFQKLKTDYDARQ